MPREYGKPRPHADVDKIKEEARRGNAFYVNRAALNGDLAQLSDTERRAIVAQANDEAARYADEQIIPLTETAFIQRENFITRHLGRAINIFFRKGGRTIQEELSEDDI